MVYFGCHLVNPHVQTVQNMYSKGGVRVFMAELRTAKVDPYFERRKITFCGVTKNLSATIFNFEPRDWITVFWYIRNTADSLARLKSENCGRKVLGNTALFLLATRVLPASPNFGQAKHGQNDPAATVCQQGICCPICEHHFTHWTHPDISLPFRAGGRRLKNFRFSRICVSLW